MRQCPLPPSFRCSLVAGAFLRFVHGTLPKAAPSHPFSRAITGVPAAATGLAVANLIEEAGASVALLVGENLGRVESIAEETPFFFRENGGRVRPHIRALPPPVASDADESGGAFEAMCDVLATLAALRHEGAEATAPLIIACSPEALRRPCPEPAALQGREIVVRRGQALDLREFVERLAKDFDYDCEVVCEAPGQFAVRGGLVDVYPLNASAPVRIDFFGEEVEAIRVFDPATQRGEAALESVVISAPVASEATQREWAFLEHLPQGVLWIWVEPPATAPAVALENPAAAASVATVTEFDSVPSWLGEWTAPIEHWEARELAALFDAGDFENQLGADRLSAEEALRERLLLALARWQYAGAVVKIVGETEGGVARLRTIVAEAVARWQKGPQASGIGNQESGKGSRVKGRKAKGAASVPSVASALTPPETAPEALGGFAPEIVTGVLASGFVLGGSGKRRGALVVATERELFGRYRRRLPSIRRRRLPHKSRVEQLLDFNELVDGDVLVHAQHGVCLYRGINTIEHRGKGEEMISLEFSEKVTTHLPLREAHLLSRYVGLRRGTPKLGKIGSGAWEKTRHAAEAATVDFAAELLALHARRHAKPGVAFPLDEAQPWLHEFEHAFPHQETPDQARAIEETKRDMERPSPMDRLICGDVGYGKTEVALRAAFKAVLGGFQVAVLAPTTVLAQQHFNTLRERFAKYPLTVEMLSRFRKPAQRTRIIGQINDGRVDIVVGTHALLSRELKFPKLGLLVIDEEHRFGVRQKELIKRLKENVDVLCMSATPIPRTLYLALMGARDLSVIETPPRERLPIRTLVRAYDPKLVQEAISYEVGRGGQVFYLHNRVDTIDAVAARLHEAMPDVRFGIGHGQMDETELENVMTRFVAGEFDVLVCTTIIETGLDIPNCNTLIIEGADRFGLAQLYQLRGRVGRFNRQAYAYLLLHKHTTMLDPARHRLSAIRQHNQLGA
ncbi:MAG: DEAD/DEAH box helicase, partial [Puniceicoccales bacterium]|nr:DEAD/DEAH box helicase [Puniceicoccales bacterium]